MWESTWLALVGLVVGTAFTLPVYIPLSRHGLDMTEVYQSGDQALEVGGVGFDMVLTVGIFPEHVVAIATCVLLATLAAGLYPAWKVGRIQPIESINLV
jgi:ABC-type lipoprotein release transport system permease subunit